MQCKRVQQAFSRTDLDSAMMPKPEISTQLQAFTKFAMIAKNTHSMCLYQHFVCQYTSTKMVTGLLIDCPRCAALVAKQRQPQHPSSSLVLGHLLPHSATATSLRRVQTNHPGKPALPSVPMVVLPQSHVWRQANGTVLSQGAAQVSSRFLILASAMQF